MKKQGVSLETSGDQQVKVRLNIPLEVVVTLGEMQVSFDAIPFEVGQPKCVKTEQTTEVSSDPYALFDSTTLEQSGFAWRAALSAAVSSRLAYESPDKCQDTCLSRWSFQVFKFIENGSSQCLVASNDTLILIAFRGTEQVGDWLTNLNLLSTTTRYGSVHRGFFDAFQSVRRNLEKVIEPIANGRKVLLTGHSLGGALATIAGIEWETKFPIHSIYTFGQPCVGTRSFQEIYQSVLRKRHYRFVNADDVVPRIPPGYIHVGKLVRFDGNGQVSALLESNSGSSAEALTYNEFESLKDRLNDLDLNSLSTAEGLLPNYFSDHKLDRYIEKIQSQLAPKSSERKT